MRHPLTSPGGRALLCALLLILILAQPVFGEDYDIFDTFYFPFLLNGREIDEIEVGLDSMFEPLYLHGGELTDLLSGRIRSEYVDQFRDQEWVSLQELKEIGIPVTYDEMNLTMNLDVPPEATLPETFSLERPPPRRFGDPVEAADFSLYTNIYSNFSYRDMFTGDPEARIDSIVFEPSANFRGWVAEGRFGYSHSPDDFLVFSDNWHARAVRYFEDPNARLMAGDIFSGNVPISLSGARGILYEQNSSLGRAPRTNTAISITELLQRQSDVTLELNDRTIFNQHLGSGEHTFEDFTLTSGVNTLRMIKDRDDLDEPIVETFSIPFDSSLLPLGAHEYALGAKFDSYDDLVQQPADELSLFGYYKKGLTHELSANYYFDLGLQAQTQGLRFHLATLHGNYTWDNRLNFDLQDSSINNFSTSLAYRFYDRQANRSFGYTTEIDTGPSYEADEKTGDDVQVTSSKLSLTLDYNQSLFPNLSFFSRNTFSYDWKEESPDVQAVTGLRHRLRISDQLNLHTNVTAEWTDFSLTASAFLSARLWDNRVSATARQTAAVNGDEDPDYSTTLSATYRPDRTNPFGNVNLQLSNFDYSRSIPESLSIGSSYGNPYLTSSFQQSLQLADESSGDFTMRVNTAFVYADGTAAMSRPVSNSFILVEPGVALEGSEIGINPRAGDYAARTGAFGTAVIPNISAFSETTLTLEPIDPPDDLYYSENQFRFASGYKQAAVIRPGGEYRVMLTGRIFNEPDDPLVFAAGDIRPMDALDDEEQMQFFFTDDAGRVFAYDLTAGTYRMTVYLRDRVEVFTLQVPDDIRGTATIGDLYLREPPEEPDEEELITLTGRIVFADGTPVSSFDGNLVRNGESFPFTTDGSGRFSVAELTPGMYQLSLAITREQFQIEIPQGMRGRLTAGVLQLEDTDPPEATSWFSLSGSLYITEAVPFDLRDALLLNRITKDTYLFSTDEQGRFFIPSVSSGEYILTVNRETVADSFRLILPYSERTAMTTGPIMLEEEVQQEQAY